MVGRTVYFHVYGVDQHIANSYPRATKDKADYFCSNGIYWSLGMFMSISDCNACLMDLGPHSDRETEKPEKRDLSQLSHHKESKTQMAIGQTLPCNVTTGRLQDV